MSSAPAFIDPYIDHETGLLVNSLGIKDENELRLAEADYSTMGLITLLRGEFSLDFVPQDLERIHGELFGVVYPWAGRFRSIEIRKRTEIDSPIFLPSSEIPRGLSYLMGKLEDDDRLVGLDDDEFVDKLAVYFNDLNYIHPFREGNGRTQRVFWSFVAAQGGRRIDWPAITGHELDIASEVARTSDDVSLLRSLFERTISYLNASIPAGDQIITDLASGMRHDSYDDYDRYGDGTCYSR